MEEKYYGPHLTIDAYVSDNSSLKDIERIYTILDELPAISGMRKITNPQFTISSMP